MKRFALDLETECAVADCKDSQCKHALIPHLARITIIGLWAPDESRIFRKPGELRDYLQGREFELVGQNLKFDLKMLHFHGYSIPSSKWVGDSQLAAHVCLDKVPQEYLSWYAAERNRRNALLKDGQHRPGSALTLKVLAPYFLGVEPFWENPENHDDPTYVLRDCEYSYRLCDFLEQKLEEQGLADFYRSKQLIWARGLLNTELSGIRLDLEKLHQLAKDTAASVVQLRQQLDEVWADGIEAYRLQQERAVDARYNTMFQAALNKKPAAKLQLASKYGALASKAKAKLEPINLDSPAQLTWLLRDHYGLNIKNFEEEDSTGKSVINRLIDEGNDGLRVYRDYRAAAKINQAFIPSYLELQRDGRIHTSFHATGTRTGRLSSSLPNCQQLPAKLHSLFIADPGRALATFDESSIEIRIICYYSEDRTLFELLQSGADFHGHVCTILFGLTCPVSEVKERYPRERKAAKEVDLSLMYGAGPKRLRETSLKYGFNWSLAECKQKCENFRREYADVFEFKKELDEFVRTNPVKNYFGRKHSFTDPDDIYLKNMNTLVQSTASDLVQDAAAEIMKQFEREGIDGQVLNFVHDELLVQIPEGSERAVDIIKEKMTAYRLPTKWGNVALAVEGKVSKCWEK